MRIDRFDRHAIRVLCDALARAECGEVERNWGHRMALEWLVNRGVAEPWQAASFWESLAPQWDGLQSEHIARQIQATALSGALRLWSRRLGLDLDPIQMARVARPYLPDLDLDCGTQQLPCMCNRYMPGERQRIEDHFSARRLREFNEGPAIVHPREPGWVVRLQGGERILEQMTWGFPVYIRGKSGQALKPKATNNARFDKLNGYWKQWARAGANRCLIPAAAYAEAVGKPGSMTTTWLSVKDAPLFAWAGLWRQSDEWGPCYTGVMTDNAPELLSIHDRSPVILAPEDWNAWLTLPLDELARFDRPWPANRTRVNQTTVLWKMGGATVPPLPDG